MTDAAMEYSALVQEFTAYIDEMSATLKTRVEHRGPLKPPPRAAPIAESEEVQLVPVTPDNFDMVEVHRVVEFEDDGAALWAIVPQHILDHTKYPGPPPCPAEWVTFVGREVREFCSAGRTVPQRIEVQVVRRGIGSYTAPQPPRHLVNQSHSLFQQDVCETAVDVLATHGLGVADIGDEPNDGELKLWASLVLSRRGWAQSRGRGDVGSEATRWDANRIDALRQGGLTLSEAIANHFETAISERLKDDEDGLQPADLTKQYSKAYRVQRSARAGRARSPFPAKSIQDKAKYASLPPDRRADSRLGYDLLDPVLQKAALQAHLRSLPTFWRQHRALMILEFYIQWQEGRLRRRHRELAPTLRAMDRASLERKNRLQTWKALRASRARWTDFNKVGGLNRFVSSYPDLADQISRGRFTWLSPSVTRPLIVLCTAMTNECWDEGGKTVIEKS